jgi:RTX calcium-binding nonapeptide repeat (4 copies)
MTGIFTHITRAVAVAFAVAAPILGLPAIASASTAIYSDGRVSFTAAPGEENFVSLDVTTDCDILPAPCLVIKEATNYGLAAGAGCVVPPSAFFPTVLCPLPASVSVDTGDLDDNVNDWAGPSTISGGTGDDLLAGNGGDDVLDGGIGSDTVIGGPGNDRVAGGPGPDLLEAQIWPTDTSPAETAGADRIEGGPDADLVSYRGRDDPLTVTVDDLANDGAPGEGDFVSRDVEGIDGGKAGDTLTGDAAGNGLYGGGGTDTIRGGPGDDYITGGVENDLVSGDEGSDNVFGGHGSDIVDGGPGVDSLYGEWKAACGTIEPCVGGSDEIRARDGTHDLIDCGEGSDHTIVDPLDHVQQELGSAGCESVDRQAVTPPPGGSSPAAATTSPVTAKALAACHRLKAVHRAACVRLARAIARCGSLRPASRKATCVRGARAVARCQSLPGKAARARCLKAIPKGRRS